jgi:hypothetical protein
MNILTALRKKQTQQITKTFIPVPPSGIIAKTEKGYFYIKGKKRFKFVSERAMETWCLPIIETKEEKLAGFATMGVLGLRDGTIAKDISDGKIYLISDSSRRHITNPDVLIWLNSSIIEVSQREILVHKDGDPLSE